METERQRALARERSAARRAAMTPKELELHRTLVAERTMVARAIISPRVAEEQRVLAQNRNTIRRANYTVEEKEQQRGQARKRRRLQKNLKKKAMPKKTDKLVTSTIEWPKAVDIGCKTNCLKKFI